LAKTNEMISFIMNKSNLQIWCQPFSKNNFKIVTFSGAGFERGRGVQPLRGRDGVAERQAQPAVHRLDEDSGDLH
jgi:hypothetical protein